MRRRTRPTSGAEAGFAMIEATLAVALVALGAGTIVTAVVAVAHQTAHGQSVAALTLSAENIVTDLRAATAYDPQVLAGLAGHTTDFIAAEPSPNGSPAPIRLRVSVTGGATAATVSVTAGNEHGEAASVQATLRLAAPAPGSIVPAELPSPPPDAGASSGSSQNDPAADSMPTPSVPAPCRLAQPLCDRAAGPIAL